MQSVDSRDEYSLVFASEAFDLLSVSHVSPRSVSAFDPFALIHALFLPSFSLGFMVMSASSQTPFPDISAYNYRGV